MALLLGINLCRAQQQTTGGQSSVPPPTPYSVVASDANSSIWERTVYEQGPNGEIVAEKQQYTQIESGLNHLVENQYIPSSEDIVMLPDGSFASTNCQFQVFWPSEIYNGEIKMVTPDGLQLDSSPVGLLLADATNSVFIATLTNSTAELISSNELAYRNAFEGLDADLLYTVTKSGLEQCVILREQPPSPAASGLDPATTRLQILTEFFNPPQPVVTATPLPNQGGLALTDETLDFGAVKMMQGRAFLLGTDAQDSGVFVGKSWVQIARRQFLIEQIPLAALTDQLATLPQGTAKVGTFPNVALRRLKLPPQHLAKASPSVHFRQVRFKTLPSKGLVLDYQTVSGAITNYDFQGDTTYYISGQVNLYGTNTFEGGCVLKYATNATVWLRPSSSINWQAADYRPVICTAKDDNTVGQTLSGSTGSPTGYYANPALYLYAPLTSTISHFRIEWAAAAIVDYSTGLNLYDGQLVNCQDGIASAFCDMNLGNLLFADVQTNFDGTEGQVNAQNVTFSGSVDLMSDSDNAGLTLENCILANIDDLTNNCESSTLSGTNDGFYNCQEFGTSPIASAFYPFQTVGGGSYYLTNGCAFLDAGTTNIDGSLLDDLAAKTVYPPVVYSNVSISVPTTLSPQAQRDNTGDPALGYHYDVLDFAFGGCNLSAGLNVTAGTAIGLYGIYGQAAGILLNNGADFIATGTATAPCWITFANSVQEGCNGQWVDSQRPPAFQFNGSGSGEPQINTTFAKMSDGGFNNALVTDGHEQGECNFQNSEFWLGGFAPYDEQFLNFSNCFFFRPQVYFWDQSDNPNITFQDCTFYGGILFIARDANGNNYPPSIVTVENTAFDGTAFPWSDPLNGNTNYTIENYNAYNTNNLSWQSYYYPYGPCYGTLQTVGANSTNVDGYNWESSWFGNYYLPPDSPLIEAGSTNADLLGLYHFTTQTNQTVEGDSIVDIGYHYVATDPYGNPLDNNGDGIPDYLEDANGNGLVDSGEIGWYIVGDLGLKVSITHPRNGSTLP